MDVNNFLCNAMLSYTKNRKLSEIASDIEDCISTKREKIQRSTKYTFYHLEGSPSFLGTGSSSEGLGILGNDYDSMAILPGKQVEFKNSHKNDRFFADTKICNNGFCYITVTQENKRFFKLQENDIMLVDNIYYLRRDELLQKIQENTNYLQQATIQGPSFELDFNLDYVPAIKCCDWPEECEGFFKRRRYWPSKEKIEELRNSGMHVVCTCLSDVNKDLLEYRTSFSLAERSLIRELSDIQFATYYFLKNIKDDFSAANKTDDKYPFKSYFIKTILLHYTECSAPDAWTEVNFLNNAKACLEKLVECYKTKSLPHFFISDCNLLLKYSNEECNDVVNDLTRLLESWNDTINEMFFWERGFDQTLKSSKSKMVTRLQEKNMIEECKDVYCSDYLVDHLALCLEADFLRNIGHQIASPVTGTAFIEALLETNDTLMDIVPDGYLKAFQLMLNRLLGLLIWRNRSTRKNVRIFLNLLHLNNVPVIYPVSGFVDDVSSKVWLGFYSYILGDQNETLIQVNSITDLDTISPIGYMSLLLTTFEKLYLHRVDPYLYTLLQSYFNDNEGNEAEDYCEVNCVVLAHYLRAKTMTSVQDNLVLQTHTLSLLFVEQIVHKVWKLEKQKLVLVNLITETGCLLRSFKDNVI